MLRGHRLPPTSHRLPPTRSRPRLQSCNSVLERFQSTARLLSSDLEIRKRVMNQEKSHEALRRTRDRIHKCRLTHSTFTRDIDRETMGRERDSTDNGLR